MRSTKAVSVTEDQDMTGEDRWSAKREMTEQRLDQSEQNGITVSFNLKIYSSVYTA